MFRRSFQLREMDDESIMVDSGPEERSCAVLNNLSDVTTFPFSLCDGSQEHPWASG